jgi:hypothetical protein
MRHYGKSHRLRGLTRLVARDGEVLAIDYSILIILVRAKVFLAQFAAIIVDLLDDRREAGDTGGGGDLIVIGPLSVAHSVDVSYL